MSDPIIEIKNASIFQQENLVLSDVNLTLHKGEFIYLIGRTGSGKSSLLKTLYGELPARDGIVHVAGYDLTTLKRKDIPYLRRKIGIVFQDFQLLFDRSVEKNLEFVLGATGWTEKAEISRRIDEVLAKVGLSDKRKSMPHQMSGGEQQGIAIARALLNDPDVIIADEPTGNLDPDTTLEVTQMARGADFESGNIFSRAKAMVPLLVPLFVSAFRRAGDLAMAMESRCYHGGDGRTRLRSLKLTRADLIACLMVACFIALIVCSGRFLPC